MDNRLRNIYFIAVLFVLLVMVSMFHLLADNPSVKWKENLLAGENEILKVIDTRSGSNSLLASKINFASSKVLDRPASKSSYDVNDSSERADNEILDETLQSFDAGNDQRLESWEYPGMSSNNQEIVSEYGYYTIVKY